MGSKFKKFFIFIFFCVFGLTAVNAKSKKIVVDDISIKEKSGTITVADPIFEKNEITSSIVFNEKDDFVTYELSLSNKEKSKYKIESIKDNNKYSNVKIEYIYDNDYIESGKTKKIGIKLSYKNKIINRPEVNLNNLTITLKLVNDEGDNSSIIINPKTGDNVIFYLYLLIIAITGLIYFLKIRKNKKLKNIKYIFVLFLLLTPLFIFALDKYEVSIKFTNIKLSSEYEKYNIIIDLGDGSDPIVREITYGDPIGNLPEITDKNGYNTNGWKDNYNNPVTKDTIVTKPITVTPAYTPIKYTINYNLNGGSSSNPSTYTIEDEIVLNNPEKPGYSFSGWTGSNGSNLQTRVTIEKGSTGNKEYEAHYLVGDNTPYKVIHKYQKIDGKTYDEDVEELKGTTDTIVSPSLKEKTGFKSPSVKQLTITGDGKATLTYIYTRNKYTFNISDRTNIDDISTPDGEYYYETKINIKAKEKAGYNFKWSDGNTDLERSFNLDSNTNLTPIYTPKTDTPYKVVHKQMNLDGKTYTEKDVFEKVGTTDTKVTPDVNTYEGFTSPEPQTVTINGNGKTVIEYLYKRNKYQVNINGIEYIETDSTSGLYYYGSKITLKAKNRPGYTFEKWSNDETSPETVITITGQTTIAPIYTSNGNTPYTVIHKQMNLDGTSYTEVDRDNLTDVTGNEVTPYTKNYEGFTSPETQTVTVEGDGSTVVEYLYKRNKYVLKINDRENLDSSSTPNGEYYYDTLITIKAKEKPGYDFKWSDNNDSNYERKFNLKSDFTSTPIFVGRTDTPYKVVHKKMNLDGETYDVFETDSLVGTTGDEVSPSVKTYEGFTSPKKQTVKINGDGSTIVNYLYERNKYTLTINNENFVNSSKPSGKYYYKTEINLKAKDRNGYNFYKWSNDYTDKEIVITLDDDITIEPIYIAKTDTPYKVVHKKMNLDGQTYTVSDTENLKGTTNESITPDVKEYTGFTSPKTKTTTISGNGDTVVEYLYKRNKYTLTLENTEYIEEGDISGEYYYGTELTLTAKDIEGKTFAKWSNNLDTKKITITINDGPLTIRPIYDTNTYTITFVPNGGEVSEETRVINEGDKLGSLPVPTRDGYIFEGWYTSLDFDNVVDENTIPNGNLSYYAKWKKSIESMIISNTNIELKIGETETINITNKEEIEEEYTFSSSNPKIATVDKNGKVTGLSEGETSIIITGTESGKTKTITIKVETNKYVVSFDSNGGNEIADREVEMGSKIGDLPVPVKENYIFDGWYTDAEYSVKITENTVPTSTTTYYAKWKKSVAFLNISNLDITLDIGEEELINITNKDEIEEEYTFTSSDTGIVTVDINGKVSAIASGTTKVLITGIESNISKEVNITVLKDKIIVTFNANGGSVSPRTKEIEQGNKVGELPVPTKKDNMFEGWYTSLIDGLPINENTIPNEDVTYYAKWLRTVEFVEIDNPNITVTKNETEKIITRYADEIQEELSFTSLDEDIATVDENGVVKGISKGQTKIIITGLISNKKVEINVLVLPIYYTVEFNSNGGNSQKTLSIEENNKVSSLPEPVKQDNIFKGWFTDSDLNNAFNIDTPITENLTLYAKWETDTSDTFKTVFYEPGVCEFNGSDERVSGDNCEHNNYNGYIDTGINLYNEENHDKDYEIGFTIDYYNSSQVNQATLMNTKLEGNNYPGVVFRRKDNTDNYDLGSRKTSSGNASASFSTSSVNKVKIFRIYNESKKVQEIYYSINDGDKILLNNLSSFNPVFNLPVWFGATPTDQYYNSAQRFFNGRLSNMYIKLGKYSDKKTYTIRFSSSYGTPNPKYLIVEEGSKIGKFPEVSHSSYETFIGWFTSSGNSGSQVDENTIPTGNTTYYAHYLNSIGITTLSKTQYNMVIGQTDNITYNSPTYYEPVTYESDNPLVATVDENGKITAVGVGSATITLRGVYSNTTKQAFVKVTNNIYTVTFNATDGATDVDSIEVEGDVAIGKLPTATKEGYVLDGWYTDEEYPVRINESYVVKKDITCYAKWSKDLSNAIIDNEMTIYTRRWNDFVIENADEIEPYTLTSNNTSILQIDSSTNSLISYNVGQTTLDVVGNTSGIKRTITVNTINQLYKVSFDSNGGSEVDDIEVEYGNNIGKLPTPTRENYTFKGWYTDRNYTNSIYSGTRVYNNMTVYALWEYSDSFPLVFNHEGSCTFNGEYSSIYGSNCTYNGYNYIDTGIYLYDSNNYDKDYEIGFTIEDYNPSNNNTSATIMNEKYEDGSKYPGIVFRRSNSSDNLELTETLQGNKKTATMNYSNVKDVKIFRINKKMYYSINNGSLIEFHDISSYDDKFSIPVWFGAAPKTNSTYEAQRFFYGTLSNMYIRLGTYDGKKLYNITFDPNEGYIDSTKSNKVVREGADIGSLPTPSRSNYTFEGWYTNKNYDTQISERTIPTNNTTYYAKWISNYNITFVTNGGTSISNRTVARKSQIGSLPTPVKEGYKLVGWYSEPEFENSITSTYVPTEDMTLYAKWESTNNTIINNQMCDSNIDIPLKNGTICRRAETLHQEVCTSNYCKNSGYTEFGQKGTNIITYGNCGTDGKLKVGDAFTCDVNGDGTFDEEKERFYYVSDYFNSETKEYESDTAVLVYYNNLYQGNVINNKAVKYNANRNNYSGPVTASLELPTKDIWSNVVLKYNEKQVLNSDNTTVGYSNRTLPIFSYENYTGRFLTLAEIQSINKNIKVGNNSFIINNEYLFENTRFSDSSLIPGYWLENSYGTNSSSYSLFVSGDSRIVYYTDTNNSGGVGVRPVIDIPKNKMEYGSIKINHTIYLNPNGGKLNQNYVVVKDEQTLDSLPEPKRVGYEFLGWYKDLEFTVKVDGKDVATEDMTLYAKWKIGTYTVTFDTDGGTSIEPYTRQGFETLEALPTTTREGYEFNGWYDSNLKKVTEETVITDDITFYAYWNKDPVCKSNQNIEALDGTICKRATNLHQEVCDKTNTSDYCIGAGYTLAGSKKTNIITYGNCGTDGELKPGDAFTCDVNGDGTFDEEKERFYYVSNYYNTVNKEFEEGVATLIYFSNTRVNEIDSYSTTFYYRDGVTKGPVNASGYLPTSWNTKLYYNNRQILDEYNNTSKDTLEYSVFRYNKKARLLTIQEINNSCNLNNERNNYELSNCEYLLENTLFGTRKVGDTSSERGRRDSYWLETIYNNTPNSYVNTVSARYANRSNYRDYYSDISVRPTIDIPKSKIMYSNNDNHVTVTFNTNGGEISLNFKSLTKGDKLGKTDAPKKEANIFAGWYTELDGGVKVDENYIVNSDITLYAHYNYEPLYNKVEYDALNTDTATKYEGVADDSYTSNGDKKIYYYNVTRPNNYAIFANYCWKVLRTTNNGGVKLIYYGIPDAENKCGYQDNNAGVIDSNTSYPFNTDNSLYSFGYMYQKTGKLLSYSGRTTTLNSYLFGNDVIYDGTYYKLVNSEVGQDSSRKYTCLNNTGICKEVSYFINSYGYYVKLKGYKNIDEFVEKSLTLNTTDSNAKQKIDDWYERNLVTYHEYIDDAIYCNDRSIYVPEDESEMSSWNKDADFNKNIYFNSSKKTTNSLDCPNDTDKFSVSNPNAKLKYPIGLATKDERQLATNISGIWTITQTYLMTPSYGSGSYDYPYMYFDYHNSMGSTSVMDTSSTGLKPVITLKNDVYYTSGDGSMDRPFMVYAKATDKYLIRFDPNEGVLSDNTRIVKPGEKINDLPTPTREGYVFKGWYTDTEFNEEVTVDTIPNKTEITYYAKWSKDNFTVTFDTLGNGENTVINRKYEEKIGELPSISKENYKFIGWFTTKDTLGEEVTSETIVTKDITYYPRFINNLTCENNQNINTNKLCRRAKELHQDQCNNINGSGCFANGYYYGGSKDTDIITYGSCGTDKELNVGDAFTCDVNGDGIYDEEKERFYYVSNYYNTDAKFFEKDTAVLLYYSNTNNGLVDKTTPNVYHTESINYKGPVEGIKMLPTKDNWSNVSLKNNKRRIINNLGYNYTGNYDYRLPEEFDYSNYSSRLLTYQELKQSCSTLTNCIFALENTKFSSPLYLYGYFLETPYSYSYSSTAVGSAEVVYNTNISEAGVSNKTNFGIRPAIEVKKDDIEYGIKYDIFFDGNGGTLSNNYLGLNEGDTLGTLPTVTRGGYTFDGWYTALDGGVKIENDMVVTESATYYARWKQETAACPNNENIKIDENTVCKRAPYLKAQTCNRSDSQYYCSGAGKRNKTVTFGNCGTDGELKSGDAFVCDVNNDGVFNTIYERFYYVSDYFDTKTKEYDDNVAVLIHASTNSSSYAYNADGINTEGPISILPGLYNTWKNVDLKFNRRNILNSNNQVVKEDFSYDGKKTRLLTLQELVKSCQSTKAISDRGRFDSCEFLFDNTYYINTSSGYIYSMYLETVPSDSTANAYALSTSERNVSSYKSSYREGLREVIELPKEYIKFGSNVEYHTVRFNPNGGYVNQNYLTHKKDEVIGNLPTPTREGYFFVGWYTSLDAGIEVKSSYVPTEDMTLYAKWEIGNYKVSFESNGGTEIDDINIDGFEKIGKLPEPVKEGHDFRGWAIDNDSFNIATEDYVVTHDVKLYAMWTDYHTITFNSNTGKFGEDKTEKEVYYRSSPILEKYYSHTENLLDDGKRNESSSYYYFKTKTDKIDFKFANRFEIDLWYNLNTSYYSWLGIYPKDINPSTSTSSNDATISKGKLAGSTGSNSSSKPDDEDLDHHKKFVVDDNSVYIYFYGNGSSMSSYYGYYATIMGRENVDVNNDYVEPTKEGATFLGWCTTSDCAEGTEFNLVTDQITKDITLYAKWGHKVTYNKNNGTSNNAYPRYIKEGDALGNVPSISRSNYTFKGWYINEYDDEAITAEFIPTEDVTLKAIWQANDYTVKFDSMGGSEVSPIVKPYNEAIGELPTPTKSDSTFKGWYANLQYNPVKITSSTKVTGNTTYYANWNQNPTCSVNENITTNDGTVCRRAKTLHQETCNESSTNNFCSYAGYRSNYLKGTTTITYGNCGEKGKLNTGDAFTCDVNNDGTFDEEKERFYYVNDYYNTSSRVYENDTAVLVYYTNIENKEAINTVSSGTPYNENNKTNSGPVTISEKLPTKEEWSNIKLKYNNRYVLSANSTLSSSSSVIRYDYSNYGARFLTLKEIYDNCKIPSSSFDYTGGLNKCYYLMENTNNLSNPTRIEGYWLETPVYNYSSTKAWAIDGRSRIFYTSDQTLNSTNYGVRPTIEVPKSQIDYGQDIPYYTITFNPNNGSLNQNYMSVLSTEEVGTLPTPSRANYRFIGWFTEEDDGDQIESTSKINKNMTLYAHWYEIPKYTLTYDTQGGNEIESKVFLEGNTIGTLPTPTKEGYRFLGWYDSSEGGNAVTTSFRMLQDTTIYAHWIKQYKVIFNSNGGSAISTKTLDENSKIGSYSVPNKEGFVFMGWYEDNETFENRYDTNTVITKDLTYYAKWHTGNACNGYESKTILYQKTCENNQNIEVGNGKVCKRASTLHQEKCTNTSTSGYCSASGYTLNGSKGTDLITYGSCGTQGELNSGDAFTCDVNGDGEFNELTERFYYLSDKFNTIDHKWEDDTAVLVFYGNVNDGKVCNSTTSYSTGGGNYKGPTSLYTLLPSVDAWPNVTLKYTDQQIYSSSGTSTQSYSLPVFSYEGKAARLIQYTEANKACKGYLNSNGGSEGALNSCNYLMEHTTWAGTGSSYFLEAPCHQDNSDAWFMQGNHRYYGNIYVGGSSAARPVIDVPKTKIQY